MRIALFTLDSLASNDAVRSFLQTHRNDIALVGLSRRPGKGLLRDAWRQIRRSGGHYCAFLAVNFLIPRWVGTMPRWSRLGDARVMPSIGQLCRDLNIHVEAIADVNDRQTHELLRRHGIELIVSCYFDQIFSAETIRIAKRLAVNIHTSMLPQNRGPVPVLYGCLSVPPSLGVTIHQLDENIDTGPILAQESYRPMAGHSMLRTMAILHRRGLDRLTDILPEIESGDAPTEPQLGGGYDPLPGRATIRKFRKQGGRLVDLEDLLTSLRTPVDP